MTKTNIKKLGGITAISLFMFLCGAAAVAPFG